MRERFTENAEKVLKLAKKAAKNNGNGYIGSEHLLLGLLEEGEGTAAILLKESGADTVQDSHFSCKSDHIRGRYPDRRDRLYAKNRNHS